jgi:HEAT repeat protein
MGIRIRLATVGLCIAAAAALAAPAPKKTKGEDLAPVIAALSGAELEQAAAAAEHLGESDQVGAHDALLDALALGLPAEVAVPAMAALTHHPAPPDVAALKRYASHRNPSVRSAALAALALYPDPIAHHIVVGGLHDSMGLVRNAAAQAAGHGRVREAVDSLFALLALGEEPAARALAQLADPELARKIAEQLGKVPDASLALCLGLILKRTDFGPDTARVEIVRAIGKIQDAAAINALTDYIDATPKTPPRPSRHEAEMMVEARMSGGK